MELAPLERPLACVVAGVVSIGVLFGCWSGLLLVPVEEEPVDPFDNVACLVLLMGARTSECPDPPDVRLPGKLSLGHPCLLADDTAAEEDDDWPPAWCDDNGDGADDTVAASVPELAEDEGGCADLLALSAASLVARCSVRSSSKVLRLPTTARRIVREWVLQVRERVHGLPLSPISTPQCLFGSYSRSLQGSNFLSRCIFFPREEPTAAVEPLLAEGAAFLMGVGITVVVVGIPVIDALTAPVFAAVM